LALVQARRLTNPVQALAGTADRLGSGDFSVTAPRSGIAELDVLADAFDSSARRIGDLVDAERSFNTNASHQLRSGLTGLRLHIEELTNSADATVRDEASAALDAADKLKTTVEEMLRLSRTGRAGVASTFDLSRLASDHASDFVPQLQNDHRTLSVAPGPPVLVDASLGAVGQIVDVLLSNSLQHGGGPVAIRVREFEGWAQLTVSDAGPGIQPDAVDGLFIPKTAGETHGLGLPLAVTLANSEGGHIDLVSTRPATFRLRLPLHREPHDGD
jgi:signal transduction histidine kinase